MVSMDKALKQFIVQIAAEAGEYLRNHFYTFKNVIEHDSGALKTNIDLELAAHLRKRIAEVYPEHAVRIQGETQTKNAEYVWLIDPLDGSSHFSRSIPIYTVTIALQHNGTTVLAAVNHAQTHQLFFAAQGGGAYLNGIEIGVSEQRDLSKALIFVELPEKKFADQLETTATLETRMGTVNRLVDAAGQLETFRIGSFGQCLVAAGAFDAYIDLSGSSEALSQAASRLILEEAGAEIIDVQPSKDGFVQIMATNNYLAAELKKIIHG